MKNGGDEEDRTPDLLNANQALSQLSYVPFGIMVGLGRLELPTPRLSSVCSNQLSYKPAHKITLAGIDLFVRFKNEERKDT